MPNSTKYKHSSNNYKNKNYNKYPSNSKPYSTSHLVKATPTPFYNKSMSAAWSSPPSNGCLWLAAFSTLLEPTPLSCESSWICRITKCPFKYLLSQQIEKLPTCILIPEQSNQLKISLSQRLNFNVWSHRTHLRLCHHQAVTCHQRVNFHLLK